MGHRYPVFGCPFGVFMSTTLLSAASGQLPLTQYSLFIVLKVFGRQRCCVGLWGLRKENVAEILQLPLSGHCYNIKWFQATASWPMSAFLHHFALHFPTPPPPLFFQDPQNSQNSSHVRNLRVKVPVYHVFFSWFGYPSRGGGGLPAFFEILGALSGIPPPPLVGVRPRVGWVLLGKKYRTKISISSRLPDSTSTIVVECCICDRKVPGSIRGSGNLWVGKYRGWHTMQLVFFFFSHNSS